MQRPSRASRKSKWSCKWNVSNKRGVGGRGKGEKVERWIAGGFGECNSFPHAFCCLARGESSYIFSICLILSFFICCPPGSGAQTRNLPCDNARQICKAWIREDFQERRSWRLARHESRCRLDGCSAHPSCTRPRASSCWCARPRTLVWSAKKHREGKAWLQEACSLLLKDQRRYRCKMSRSQLLC